MYLDSNPEFQLVVGFHGGLYDPLTKLVHFTGRDYDVLAGRWTSPDYAIWPKIGKDPAPFNLYMFKNNNPLSDMMDLKNYVTGKRPLLFFKVLLWKQSAGVTLYQFSRKSVYELVVCKHV